MSLGADLDRGADLAILPPVPNPVPAGSRTISFCYGLRADSPVDLSIYDILGNPVAVVVHSDHENAGIYEVGLPISSSFSSGSYTYRLSGAGKNLSGRFVISR